MRPAPEASPGHALFLPRGRTPSRARPRAEWTLPPHLQQQVPRRLRNIALLYSGAFFASDFLSDLLMGSLAQTFRKPSDWVPPAASILTGLAVAALASSPRMTWRGKLRLGLVFEVLGSYGIALAMYLGAERFAS